MMPVALVPIFKLFLVQLLQISDSLHFHFKIVLIMLFWWCCMLCKKNFSIMEKKKI